MLAQIKARVEASSIVHARLRARLEALGLTPEAGSRKSGLDKTYLKKLFARPNSSPKGDTLNKLATGLETTTTYILGQDQEAPTTSGGVIVVPAISALDLPPHSELPPRSGPLPDLLSAEVREANVEYPAIAQLPRDVPVYGTAAGSFLGQGAFQFEGGVIEFVRRPPALMGSKAVYALYVEGTSMSPEHNPGDLRFVHTTRPPRPGDSVIVQLRTKEDGEVEGYIGRYVKQTPQYLVIHKLNPESTVQLKRDYVVAVHRVLTVNDMFGV